MTLLLRRKRLTIAESTPPATAREPAALHIGAGDRTGRLGPPPFARTLGQAIAVVFLVAISAAWSPANDPTASTANPSASSSAGQECGSKLKWLPYRPAKPLPERDRAGRRVSSIPTGRVVAAQWVARTPSHPAQETDPFEDPFGDGLSASSPSAAGSEAGSAQSDSQAPGPLLAGSALQGANQQPTPAPPPMLPAEPPATLSQPPAPAGEIDLEPRATQPDSAALQPPAEPESTGTEEQQPPVTLPPIENGAWTSQVTQRRCPSPTSKEFYTPIGELDTDTRIKPDTQQQIDLEEPVECVLSTKRLDPHTLRSWSPTTFTWKASGLCHHPLYFEDVQLERYGHSHGPYLQPIISGAHFFLSVPTLPYQIAAYPPQECVYTLGYYRPGNCAPYVFDPLPLSIRGGLAEGGIWTAAVFLVP